MDWQTANNVSIAYSEFKKAKLRNASEVFGVFQLLIASSKRPLTEIKKLPIITVSIAYSEFKKRVIYSVSLDWKRCFNCL